MSWWTRLLNRPQMDAQLDKELGFHLEQHTTELIVQGYSPEEAGRMARLAFGGAQQITEQCRDARGTRWLEDLLQDVRYAIRTLRQVVDETDALRIQIVDRADGPRQIGRASCRERV